MCYIFITQLLNWDYILYNSISTVISSFSLLLSRGYIIDLSETLNIILISFILCQLLHDDHRHPSKILLVTKSFPLINENRFENKLSAIL